MEKPRIVARDEWLVARKRLLAREREFRRLRDALDAERRTLPWVRLARDYTFVDAGGPVTLQGLFDGCSRLLVHHFMFEPGWDEGCKRCSFIADRFDAAAPRLRAQDVALVAVSRAPRGKIEAFKRRMRWQFRWLSASDGAFDHDFNLSFTPEELAGDVEHDYRPGKFPLQEAPGLSMFVRDGEGIYHATSSYACGQGATPGAGDDLEAWLQLRGRDEP